MGIVSSPLVWEGFQTHLTPDPDCGASCRPDSLPPGLAQGLLTTAATSKGIKCRRQATVSVTAFKELILTRKITRSHSPGKIKLYNYT